MHSLEDKMKCRPDRKYGSRECPLGIQKAGGRFDTSGLRQPPLDSHRCEVHDENGVDHMSDRHVVVCSQTFEMLEIP